MLLLAPRGRNHGGGGSLMVGGVVVVRNGQGGGGPGHRGHRRSCGGAEAHHHHCHCLRGSTAIVRMGMRGPWFIGRPRHRGGVCQGERRGQGVRPGPVRMGGRCRGPEPSRPRPDRGIKPQMIPNRMVG